MTTRLGDRPDVVLVTVDCMRRDRLSAYGYERRTTPFLDGLLDSSLHCTSAHAASCWTCPSVASLLTGRYPHRHGGGLVPGEMKNLSKQNLPTVLPRDVPTLVDVLGPRGYACAAFGAVWNAHLCLPGRFPEMTMLERPGPRVLRRALRWAARQTGPYFLWLHLGDAHEPLDVPRSLWSAFGDVPKVRKVRQWDYTTSGADVGSLEFERYRSARTRLYDAAIRSVDATIAELWDALGRLGRRDRTALVVTADHGEEFWEHREEEIAGFTDPRDIYGVGHGHNLFQVHLLVPLVVRAPGVEPRSVEGNVSLVDVVPTLLDVLDVPAPSGIDGRSLVRDDADAPDRVVLAEAVAYGHEKRSVVIGDRKLLSAPQDRYERAFALGDDRTEVAPIVDDVGIAALRSRLPSDPSRVGEQVEATDEIVEHLRDLGYIE